MIRKIENISKQIEDQIQIKELEVSNIIRDVPPIILILERGFVEMKSLVLSENFKTNSDEIHFFKETKPKLFSKLIYYKKIHNIELNKPVCGFALRYAYGLHRDVYDLHRWGESLSLRKPFEVLRYISALKS